MQPTSRTHEREEVTVVTERPPVVFAPDRTIYSAEGLAVGAGGSGTQLLEGIPELEVDIDGSIVRLVITGHQEPDPLDSASLPPSRRPDH